MKKSRYLAVALPLIRVVRSQKIILDSDLARLYGVTTSQLNQQFRRNRRRFPLDFAFELTAAESQQLRSWDMSTARRNLRRPPVAFTEHGALMAANVLKSDRAVTMSVEVVRAFVSLRRIAASHQKIARLLKALEEKVVRRLDRHDEEIAALFGTVAVLVEGGERSGSA